MPNKLALQTTSQSHGDEGNYDCGKKGVRSEDEEIYRARDARPGKPCDTVVVMVRQVRDQEQDRGCNSRYHAGAMRRYTLSTN